MTERRTIRRTTGTAMVAAVAGALTWTAAEYGLHRFLMHEMRGRGLASKEHLRHHADVTYFSAAWKKSLSAAGGTAIVFPVANRAAGRNAAASFTGGLIGMYLAYEGLHRRAHTHAPGNRYGRWIRRNHLQHHAGSPMRNFGVTNGVWDRVFRSADATTLVVLPRRIAPVWLLDETGEVRAEFTDSYEVRGVRHADPEQVRRDWDAAFANESPAL